MLGGQKMPNRPGNFCTQFFINHYTPTPQDAKFITLEEKKKLHLANQKGNSGVAVAQLMRYSQGGGSASSGQVKGIPWKLCSQNLEAFQRVTN